MSDNGLPPVVDLSFPYSGSGLSTSSVGSVLNSAVNKVTDVGSSLVNKITSTDFLVSAGVGLLGSLLGSSVKRPSLNFPALAATTQVALSVGQALKAGAATIDEIASNEKGLKTSSSLQPNPIKVVDAQSDIDSRVWWKSTDEIRFITYPTDLPMAYSIGLTFYEYERLKFYSDAQVKARDVIRLPLPTNLVDALSLSYNNLQLGPLRGPLTQQLGAFAGKFENAATMSDVGSLVGETGRDVLSALADPDIARLVARSIAQGISPDTASALDLALGNTPNPHTTVSFNGVNLRAFQFSWRLSPNNARDAEEMQRLIYALKSKSLPRRDGKYLLKFPDYVKVKLYPEALNNMFNFRSMIVDSFAVNYAPSGNVSFHGDDTPTEVEIILSLRETEIQTSEQYDSIAQKFNARGSS